MKMKVIARVGLALIAAAGLFAAVVSVQLYNTMKQDKVARNMAIEQWLAINPDGNHVVNSYRALCEGGPTASTLRSGKSHPLTFAECSAHAGSASLAQAIEQASATVVAPAPLRWL